MRKIVLTVIYTITMLQASAQVVNPIEIVAKPIPQVVTDPTAYQHFVRSVNETRKQVQAAKEQVDLLTSAKEALTKVNNLIREVYIIEQVITDQVYVTQKVSGTLKQLEESKTFNIYEMTRITGELTLLVSSSQRTLSLLEKVIKDGLFKMDDYQRLEFLKGLQTDMQETRAVVNGITASYQRAMNLKIMKKALEVDNKDR